MELKTIAEWLIAGAGAIGLRQIIMWAYRRWSHKDRINAETRKIEAETKNTEIQSLSNIIRQLNERINWQEIRLIKLEEVESKYREENRKLKNLLEDCRSKEVKHLFSAPPDAKKIT